MTKRVALVTGSSSGLGLAIVRSLCKKLGDDGIIYLTARNEGRGMEAVDVLKKEGFGPKFHILDVNDQGSIDKLRDDIANQEGGLDILVNNAGIIFNDDTPKEIQAEKTIQTNYFAVRNVTNAFLPIIRNGGRIVHIASLVAPMAFYKMSEEMQDRFRNVNTDQGISDLMEEYVDSVKSGNTAQIGFADWSYGTSKLGVTTLTRTQGEAIKKDPTKKDVLINCCCPGFLKTRFTAHFDEEKMKQMITPDQGADTPVYLALLPPETKDLQGQFLFRREIKDFYNNDIRPVSFV
ncbi:carbonyl reductase [NADPH] 3-like [Lytechinus variegatus]|uniref:carbonyl reductase [NADPH] 3-like n=1 Tax=Lytechinus variegatus TaxID=7654 RepID=UPI001BB18986|nr:carbonyl reductase [NADPH] 3-like [Lytechinus variegatus]